MIDQLDKVLVALFKERMPTITADDQVGFVPPDSSWKSSVSGADKLNVYLYRFSEELQLRTNGRNLTRNADGTYVETPPDFPLRCHYLITAWSAATSTAATTPTRDEHLMLHEALQALLCHQPLRPLDLIPGGVGAPLDGAELPVTVIPQEAMSTGEFWSSMDQPWRPAIEAIITMPVRRICGEVTGAIVTTITTSYLDLDEALVQIAGVVRDGAGQPVVDAWIKITPPGRTTTTGPDGEFHFALLDPSFGTLTAEVRAQGKVATSTLTVPSASGSYDLTLT